MMLCGVRIIHLATHWSKPNTKLLASPCCLTSEYFLKKSVCDLLTNKDVSLIMRGRSYSSCVRSSMLHGSETWPVRKENVVALQRAEMRMVRWMCGVKLKDRWQMEEGDKGCLIIRMGVSGWVFLLVPAYPGCPGPTAVKRLCVCVCKQVASVCGRRPSTSWCPSPPPHQSSCLSPSN